LAATNAGAEAAVAVLARTFRNALLLLELLLEPVAAVPAAVVAGPGEPEGEDEPLPGFVRRRCAFCHTAEEDGGGEVLLVASG
jgi:hypothetical protein